MKLAQQESFSPIALIFETREEAEMFWQIIREVDAVEPKLVRMVHDISNLFSNEARL